MFQMIFYQAWTIGHKRSNFSSTWYFIHDSVAHNDLHGSQRSIHTLDLGVDDTMDFKVRPSPKLNCFSHSSLTQQGMRNSKVAILLPHTVHLLTASPSHTIPFTTKIQVESKCCLSNRINFVVRLHCPGITSKPPGENKPDCIWRSHMIMSQIYCSLFVMFVT